MATPVPDDEIRVPRAQSVIAEPVIAAVAARAAVGVPGVVRLEPGLTGLASQVARSVRQKINGLAPAPSEGVRVTVDCSAVPSSLHVSVDMVASGHDQAGAVGRAVQREVTRAVADATGLTPQAVVVSIMDIDSYGTGAW
ncbi:Asp23/Gls24 family envelope stress response protein [Streptomyces sp. NBC_00316]|uniref:Asp23/Gls24 family envelope stress response protein n=1 Tax=Streptomyces sp. NBC_00316 TaxID=2975710 RepID=UPI002E2D142E|nr:Asp23/Gls24 family envelope stress response protein [Streptomyces sp. NBC_00316]